MYSNTPTKWYFSGTASYIYYEGVLGPIHEAKAFRLMEVLWMRPYNETSTSKCAYGENLTKQNHHNANEKQKRQHPNGKQERPLYLRPMS